MKSKSRLSVLNHDGGAAFLCDVNLIEEAEFGEFQKKRAGISGKKKLLFLTLNTLYWPQLVLFEQSNIDRFRNILLFSAKYLWKVLGVGLLQLAYWGLFVLLAPWTLLLIPVMGAWYITFLSLHLLYVPLNEELQIEERFRSAGNT